MTLIPNSKTAYLEIDQLQCGYDSTPVINGISFWLERGQIGCLLGPSGCGKSTALRAIAGFLKPFSGSINVNGRCLSDNRKCLPPEKRNLGMVFQDYALFPHMTVRENLGFGLNRLSVSERERVCDEYLELIRMSGYANAYPAELSGGQQQRVAVARSLAIKPDILLLDEPFSGLDVARRAQIRTETLRLVKQTGVATLMVTHDPEEAMFMADRILVMNEGRVVQDGRPTNLYFSPADAFVAELFGPVNRFQTKVQNGMAETPLGRFDAAHLADGADATVLIRPEAIRLGAANTDPHAMPGDAPCAPAKPLPPGEKTPPPVRLEVITARPLGRSTFVMLRLDGGATLEARVPGVFLPDSGDAVSVAVNANQAHVFAATS